MSQHQGVARKVFDWSGEESIYRKAGIQSELTRLVRVADGIISELLTIHGYSEEPISKLIFNSG